MTGRQLSVGVDATTWANDRGFGRFTRELLRAMIARDSRLKLTLVFDRAPADGLPDGAEVFEASTARSLNESAVGEESRSVTDLIRLAMAVRRAKFDVFFFPAVYSYFPILTRTPAVVCYHDCTAERFPEYLFPKKTNHLLWRLKTRLALAQTARALTVTESSARDIESILKVPRDRIDVTTEGADPLFRVLDPSVGRAARLKYGAGVKDDLLVTLGGMNAHKNILGLLNAMPAILARRPGVKLAIVGDTSGRGFWDNVPELMAFVAANPPLADHVRFTGYLSDEAVVELLNGADALVFPSLWEGFGLPAVEAMQCGTPVISSTRGSLPEVIGEAGLFFDPTSVEDIAAKVLQFLENPTLRKSLPKVALDRARQFSWDRAAELAEASLIRCYEGAQRRR